MTSDEYKEQVYKKSGCNHVTSFKSLHAAAVMQQLSSHGYFVYFVYLEDYKVDPADQDQGVPE